MDSFPMNQLSQPISPPSSDRLPLSNGKHDGARLAADPRPWNGAASGGSEGEAPNLERLQALLRRHDQPVPRYTSYPTAAAFHAGVTAADLVQQLRQPSDEPLSLYTHLPFCRHACWYCGCNRITTQLGSRVVAPYVEALGRELELQRAVAGRRRLAQLHWGGGTPNYLKTEECETLWRLIERHFQLEPHLEASIELNPEFLSRDQVLGLRRLGFRRVSFGIQDADPQVQQAVNRIVPEEQLWRVMAWLREADFESVNVDLICGLPLQSRDRFAATLELVRQLAPDRIALFSFAYLPAQLPLQRRIRPEDLPDADSRVAMLVDAQQLFSRNGYDAIGLDHFARRDDKLAIAARQGELHRNFQGYTTGAELEVLGLGTTAISQFRGLLCQNQRRLRDYIDSLARGELPVERGVRLVDPQLIERRRLITSVMCRFEARFDPQHLAEEWQRLQHLAEEGLVTLETPSQREAVVRVTATGRWVLRSIAAVFDPEQQRQVSGSRLI
ncbi:MAG: oxygen-independent coproporphyrinogen III oxidase [Synechococcaceae cyanobacterium]